MSKFAGLMEASAGVKLSVLATGFVILGGIFYLIGAFDGPDDSVLAVSEPVATVTPKSIAAVEPQPVTPEPEATPAPSDPPEIAAPADNIAPEADVPAPRFDLVRVEQDGTTLIAGTGTPETEIVIVMDGAELGRVTSDNSGAFVSFLSLPQSDGARVLSLVSRDVNGDVASEEQVILAPNPVVAALAPVGDTPSEEVNAPEAPADAQVLSTNSENAPASNAVIAEAAETASDPDAVTAEVAEIAPAPDVVTTEVAEAAPDPDIAKAEVAETPPDTDFVTPEAVESAALLTADGVPGPELQQTTAVAAVEPQKSTPEVPSEAVSTPPKVTTPAPVTVLRADADGVEVLQPAVTDTAPEVMASVALDAISYSDIGDVQLSGRAPDQGSVRVYLDNAPVATLEVDDKGRWRGDLPQVETGVYTLRIDQVDASGAVTSRVETPFKREEPEVLSAALAQQGDSSAQVRAVTVQTGATLWAIARDTYGDGMLFVRVFDANRDSIRDPDLIYPGQVFALPE
jgi:nucleoid-associated protein YgaU